MGEFYSIALGNFYQKLFDSSLGKTMEPPKGLSQCKFPVRCSVEGILWKIPMWHEQPTWENSTHLILSNYLDGIWEHSIDILINLLMSSSHDSTVKGLKLGSSLLR